MKTVWNVFLGLTAAASAAVLLLQHFALTEVTPSMISWLKILGTLCCQWFFLRISKKKVVQAIPFMIAWAGYMSSVEGDLVKTMQAQPTYLDTCLKILGFLLFGYTLANVLKAIILKTMYDVARSF